MSFDYSRNYHSSCENGSQSLSSRAMSFDYYCCRFISIRVVSIPFEQGNVFRHSDYQEIKGASLVSIPFEQGNVFRLIIEVINYIFSVSQSLSSRAMSFDTNTISSLFATVSSQSLSSRAMSFDLLNYSTKQKKLKSQSLSSRAMSFD